MVRGWGLKQERESKNLASLMAAIYNTIPKGKNGKMYTADDFLASDTSNSNSEVDELSIEERRAKALEAIEKTKRFEKGVIRSSA